MNINTKKKVDEDDVQGAQEEANETNFFIPVTVLPLFRKSLRNLTKGLQVVKGCSREKANILC